MLKGINVSMSRPLTILDFFYNKIACFHPKIFTFKLISLCHIHFFFVLKLSFVCRVIEPPLSNPTLTVIYMNSFFAYKLNLFDHYSITCYMFFFFFLYNRNTNVGLTPPGSLTETVHGWIVGSLICFG